MGTSGCCGNRTVEHGVAAEALRPFLTLPHRRLTLWLTCIRSQHFIHRPFKCQHRISFPVDGFCHMLLPCFLWVAQCHTLDRCLWVWELLAQSPLLPTWLSVVLLKGHCWRLKGHRQEHRA